MVGQRRLEVVTRPLDDLTPDPNNPRHHHPKQITELARSIARLGFHVPILIDGSGKVLAGHGRLEAVRLLGWNEIPTITLHDLTPAQARAFMIADNRFSDASSWDDRLLAEHLKFLSDANLDFDIDVTGFELPEIDLRIQGLVDEQVVECEETVDLPVSGQPAISRAGDLWTLGNHRIFCGDALEKSSYARLVGRNRVAMVMTDPPYNVRIKGHVSGNGAAKHREFAMASGEMSNIEFTAFLTTFIGNARDIAKAGAIHYFFMDWRHLSELHEAIRRAGGTVLNVICWDKGVGGMGSYYRSQHELVFMVKFGKDAHTNNIQLGRFGRNRTNVWKFSGSQAFTRSKGEGDLLALHPTIKPVAMIAEALLDASLRGEVVLDPFLGSGTTLLAAERTGRIGYGMEVDPLYVDTAIRRLQRAAGLTAVHAESGRSFDEVAAERVEVGTAREEKDHG